MCDSAIESEPIQVCDRHLSPLVEIQQHLLACNDVSNCYTHILDRLGSAIAASYIYAFEANETEANETEANETEAKQNPSQRGSQHWVAEWCANGMPSQIDQRWQTMFCDEISPQWEPLLCSGDVIARTASEFSTSEQKWFNSQGVTSILVVPLIANQKFYGSLGIFSSDHAVNWGKDSSTMRLVRGVATAIALRLDDLKTHVHTQGQLQSLQQQLHHLHQLNAHLVAAAQKHTAQLQQALNFEALLRRITDRVRDSLDEEQILQTVVHELATVLETYSCDTGLYDLERGTSTIVYEYVRSAQFTSGKGSIVQLVDYPEIYSQLWHGHYVQFCWISPPRSWNKPPATIGRELHAPVVILCCPIIDDQGVIGDIWLYNSGDKQFESETVRLVEQVANQCAIAIRQARLYQEAQAKVRELEQLNYLKDDFLNTVSHELRSPMANIEMVIQMLELLLFDNATITSGQNSDRNTSSTHSSSIHPAAHTSTQASTNPPLHEPDASLVIHPALFQQLLRYFRMLQDECTKETNLINDLLDLSRLEAGIEPLMLTTIDLRTWIPHIVEPFLERARTQRQHLQIYIAADVPVITTDLSNLERILSELLHNACKYTPPEGSISISAFLTDQRGKPPEINQRMTNGKGITSCLMNSTHQGTASLFYSPVASSPAIFSPALSSSVSSSSEKWIAPDGLSCYQSRFLWLQVQNSGVEIPPTELPRIFDKFYRVPSNDPWKYGGTGLGLALVKRLVDHLGASIRVESGNDHVVFTIAFPMGLDAVMGH